MTKKKFIGTLFLVVGNSGSGKDSIIQGVVRNYPSNLKKVVAPKRYITRPPSKTENNIPVTPEEFSKMSKRGKFALEWKSYGFNYGVPIEIDEWLQKGHPVAVNVSRNIVQEAKALYEKIKVVFIEVPYNITLKRLKDRGRESGKKLEERLIRAKKNQKFSDADFIVDNSGPLNDAIDQFINYIIQDIKK